ncbi:4a-hydroxytetrahydrobiopterin dehydratase [Mycobacterium sp. Root135]|uniref:VOC family protein n=1 Tax=Mycobacterium sp. Root135 TaxID=1736457 RepID=UPI0006FB9B4A|nr:VOC family protein [Mycobacterium sp. Root135]KQY09783.1 4a-hydroxytetrahydrobiopterin dehydratase [Mycobacterium sp. Root135]
MTEPLTRQRISDVVDPLGWRLILGVAVTHVRVPTLAAAAEAAAVAISTDGVDGHLTVDLHADRVVLRMHTIDAGSVTEPDLELVARVTEALSDRGLRAQPGDDDVAPQTFEIAVDALDIALIRPFWQAVTGYVDEPGPPDLPDGGLQDPLRRGPTIWFQQMDAPRPQRNRIHLDVDVPPELARPRVDAALAAGGTLKSDAAAPAFWVLADAEGNEVCICTWQGRD